jgi:transposase
VPTAQASVRVHRTARGNRPADPGPHHAHSPRLRQRRHAQGKAYPRRLAKHGRFQMHFTPVHCSWMNQVEQWFSIIQRKRLTAPNLPDVNVLEQRLMAFIKEWNETAHPFKWTTKSWERRRGQERPRSKREGDLLALLPSSLEAGAEVACPSQLSRCTRQGAGPRLTGSAGANDPGGDFSLGNAAHEPQGPFLFSGPWGEQRARARHRNRRAANEAGSHRPQASFQHRAGLTGPRRRK